MVVIDNDQPIQNKKPRIKWVAFYFNRQKNISHPPQGGTKMFRIQKILSDLKIPVHF